MLSQPTKSTIIRVEERRFRVVPVVFGNKELDKNLLGQNGSPEKNKYFDNEKGDDLGGWINVDDGVPEEVECNKFEDNQTCAKSDKSKVVINDDDSYTHFASVPLNIKGFQDQLQKLHTEIRKVFENKLDNLLLSPPKAHLTLLMLKLGSSEKLAKLEKLQGQIQKNIANIVQNQNLSLSVGDLKTFSSPNKNEGDKIIYASIKENKGFKLIKEIIHAITNLLLEEKVILAQDLTHVSLNPRTKMYELDEPHITILRNPNNQLKPNDIDKFMSNFRRFSWSDTPIEYIDIVIRTQFESNGQYKTLYRFYLKQ